MELNSKKITQYVFVGVVVVELLALMMGWEHVRHFSKPMLMPVLLFYLRQGTTGRLSPSFLFAAVALIFSFVGDSFLMYEGEMYFMIGLAAFAVAHIAYIVAFSNAVNENTQGPNPLAKVLYAIPFVFLFVFLLMAIWSNLGGLKIPVAVYAAILISMVLAAIYRHNRSNIDSVRGVIFGAILFLLSDSLLALNMFFEPMQNAGIWIMSTYILAQWNIINGLQKHYNY
ncbi:lysoplasmalogenase [Reichenbachiella ulvae]|uniref:Lysoplasmalogenase n=1 Tax=Reichenbachiella ulvae TaxID=2980104 RepID=A0ABT3CNS2_9BACT|nr:lysoplasmalogenase [Reichenbachiella ulvae]MCV9385178.1 lysoplasmalogenase [Reichenbachiella ulvae]